MKKSDADHHSNMNICDIHTHLLPGIDDGSDSWEETMEMVRAAYAGGVRTIIATPHFLPWEEEHNTGKVRPLCEELAGRIRAEQDIHMEIYPGQELYYYGGLTDDLDSGRALTLAGTRNVLIEFAEAVSFDAMQMAVIRLTRGGYRPVIAHFERFACLRERGRVGQIRELGAGIQSNIHAVQLRENRFWLKRQYRAGAVDYIGSDMHNTKSRPPVMPQDLVWYERHLSEDYLRQVMSGNGLRFLRGHM